MTRFVLDASVAVAFFIEDRATMESDAILGRVLKGDAHVPSHWSLEVANALLKTGRSLRLPVVALQVELLTVETLAARSTVHALHPSSMRASMSIAIEQRLSSYDAVYLELALRLGVPLATWDRALKRAAAASGVTLLTEAGT